MMMFLILWIYENVTMTARLYSCTTFPIMIMMVLVMMILTTINYCWELELNLWGKLDSITITQTHHQRAELELASKLHCPYHDDVERDVGADNVDDDEKHLEAEAEREGEGDDDDDEGEAGEGPPEHHN